MAAGAAGVAVAGIVGVGNLRVAVGVRVAGGVQVAVGVGGASVEVATWTVGATEGVAGDGTGVDVAGDAGRRLNWQARSRMATRIAKNRRRQRAECMEPPETSYPMEEPDKRPQQSCLAGRRISGCLGSFYHVRQREAKVCVAGSLNPNPFSPTSGGEGTSLVGGFLCAAALCWRLKPRL